ncbi:MAG TPA: selenium-binding protein SBP56-related protein, partial [Caulobacteraceae bacterium]|nr:selenium-binding protein SBP56-related protein [Caulobacteraceae bacterium]
MTIRPDPTFYATAKLAMEAPVETYAYTLMLSPDFSQPDGLAVVGVDPSSSDYGKIVHTLFMPNKGDEFHHFGWNACSSCHDDAGKSRRFMVVPGFGSGRIHVLDTLYARAPTMHKIIEPEEIKSKTGLSAPHTVHCLADGHVMISMLGDA